MTEHYFSRSPQTASEKQIMTVRLRGQTLKLQTDRGVFAKGRVDFGSQFLIESIRVPEEASLLDIGCGYGPIGLSLAKESSRRSVTLADVNRRALELARQNALLNGVAEQVQVVESDLFQSLADSVYDCIVSNPPVRAGKQVVHALLHDSTHYLRDGGELWIVIQKKQGAKSALHKLQECFADVREVAKKKGYRIIRAKK
jgi:16S rRNA (guanine1207-N2)-methyltransferase